MSSDNQLLTLLLRLVAIAQARHLCVVNHICTSLLLESTPTILTQTGKHLNSSGRSTVKEVGLRNEGWLLQYFGGPTFEMGGRIFESEVLENTPIEQPPPMGVFSRDYSSCICTPSNTLPLELCS